MILLLFAVLLLRFPHAAASGALEGLTLCFRQVIPAVFPYLVLSALAFRLGGAELLGRPFRFLLRRLFHLPESCAPALVFGFLGGYPVGAKTAASLYRSGSVSKDALARLLSFCSNAGPGFLLGFVGAGVFGSPGAGWVLWCIHMTAALAAGLLLRKGALPPQEASPPGSSAPLSLSAAFSDALSASVRTVPGICAPVIFFSVVISLLTAAEPFGFSGDRPLLQALWMGALELTAGTAALAGPPTPAAAAAAAALLGWGGLSVHLQTLSVLEGTGVSLKYYFRGKLLQAVLSAIMAYAAFSLPLFAETGLSPAPAHRLSSGISPLCFLLTGTFFLCRRFLRKKAGKSHPHRL